MSASGPSGPLVLFSHSTRKRIVEPISLGDFSVATSCNVYFAYHCIKDIHVANMAW